MSELPALAALVCDHCHNRFLLRAGPCPRCGSADLTPVELPPAGQVLAATQLEAPPAGWSAPHRLALVELEGSVRVLALVDGELPALGSVVDVRRDGERVRAAAAPDR